MHLLKQAFPKLIFFLTGFAALFSSHGANADHLVGGDITYRWIQNIGTSDQYEIIVKVYRDCTSSTDFDPTIAIGFYEDNMPNAPKYFTLNLSNPTVRSVKPPSLGSECSFQPTACLQEAIYRGTVTLPYTDFGFHMMYIRCCRNRMVNVPLLEGQTYYAYIPASKYKNSSPTFASVPAPYLCAADTAQLLSTASEKDGDSLVYKFVHPYAGADDTNPAPGPPNLYSPPPIIRYNPGYSYLQPFGNNGYASIHPNNGLAKIYVPATGWYAIATEIEEYRDGILISRTRRDLEIIVISCPPNPIPQRTAVGGTIPTSYYVNAGETLNFELQYSDNNKMTFEATGELMDGSIPGNKPVVQVNSSQGSLTANVNWTTTCTQARTQPYKLTTRVIDDGCPPKFIYQVINVYVLPFEGTQFLDGPTEVCSGPQGAIYTSAGGASSTWKWDVQGGTIAGASNGKSIRILWTKAGTGKVTVSEINQSGCVGLPTSLTVTISPPPVTPPITGPAIACLGKSDLYSVTNTEGSAYSWKITGGTFEINGPGSVTITWNKIGPHEIKLIETNSKGCVGDTIRKQVVVSSAIAGSIYGSNSVCPFSKRIDYWVTNQSGSQYTWIVTGGMQVSGGNSSHIRINWGAKGNGLIKVVE
nr:hypothetical protein [Bacteroidota bacterium]